MASSVWGEVSAIPKVDIMCAGEVSGRLGELRRCYKDAAMGSMVHDRHPANDSEAARKSMASESLIHGVTTLRVGTAVAIGSSDGRSTRSRTSKVLEIVLYSWSAGLSVAAFFRQRRARRLA